MQLKVINQQEVLGKDFKVYGTPEEPLFLAKDVAEWIDHSRASEMLKTIDEEEKLMQTILASGQRRDMWFVTEDGLYEILMQSRKPIAKQFKRRVKEILKTIRMTGEYKVPTNPMDALKIMFEVQNETKEQLDQVDDRVTELEDNVPLSSSEYGYISRQVNHKVMEFAEVKQLQDNNDVKKLLFKDINSGIRAVAGVTMRSQLRNRHFNDVLSYIRDWIPSQSTLVLIDKLGV